MQKWGAAPQKSIHLSQLIFSVEVEMMEEDFSRIDELVPPKGYIVRYYDEANAIDFRPHSHRSFA